MSRFYIYDSLRDDLTPYNPYANFASEDPFAAAAAPTSQRRTRRRSSASGMSGYPTREADSTAGKSLGLKRKASKRRAAMAANVNPFVPNEGRPVLHNTLHERAGRAVGNTASNTRNAAGGMLGAVGRHYDPRSFMGRSALGKAGYVGSVAAPLALAAGGGYYMMNRSKKRR